MNDIIISGTSIESTMDSIANKLNELGFKNTDPCTMVDDINALAIAIVSENEALIYGAFEYLKSGRGFKNPTVTIEKWRELYRWIQRQYIYKEA